MSYWTNAHGRARLMPGDRPVYARVPSSGPRGYVVKTVDRMTPDERRLAYVEIERRQASLLDDQRRAEQRAERTGRRALRGERNRRMRELAKVQRLLEKLI